ncbi:MAG: response regulator [Desulfobacterales bacterium]
MKPRILLVSSAPGGLEDFRRLLEEESGCAILCVPDGESALREVRKKTPLAVILEEELLDMPGLELVRRLLPIHAFIHTAVLSDLPAAAFHRQAEGLGILAQLPAAPQAEDARRFLERLKKLSAPPPARGGAPVSAGNFEGSTKCKS